MNDLISRKAAIDATWFEPSYTAPLNVLTEVRDRLKALPSAQQWIPVSERLPRARESVLLAVNHKYGNWVGEGCYWETTDNHIIWKGYRWNATYWDDEIIAWMPLPEAYREDGELNV